MQFRETPSDREVSPPSVMDIFVETLTGTAFEVRVSPFQTVMSIKSKIQRMEGIPASQQHLIWQSKELEDENCLHDYHITDGSTLKLVLAMRGGPINTRRIPIEDPSWREMMEYMEANRDEIWEKLPGGRQVTLLVFRDGDQINFFRVIDRGDGTLSPLTETLSSSMRALNEEEIDDTAVQERVIENAVTLQKMHALRSKMDALNLRKKPKKIRSSGHCVASRTPSHHVLAVKPKIHNGYSLNKHNRLPPVIPATHTPNSETATEPSNLPDIRSATTSTTGSLPKVLPTRTASTTGTEIPKARVRPTMSYAALEAYHRSVMQLQPGVSSAEGSDLLEESPENVMTAMTTATGVKPKAMVVPRMNRTVSAKRKILYSGRRLDSIDPADLQQTLAKYDPRISVSRNSSGRTGKRDRFVGSGVGLTASRLQLHPLEKMVDLRPKTSPTEKWDKSLSDVSLRSSPDSLPTPSKDLCFDYLNRAAAPRMRLRSQGSTVLAGAAAAPAEGSRERRRSRAMNPEIDLAADVTDDEDCNQDIELVSSLVSSPEENQSGLLRKYSLEDNKAVAQEISLKATQLLLRFSTNHSNKLGSSSKTLPPVPMPKKLAGDPVVPRCQVCKKKTGLATSYTCRCGKNFCASHRYAETHDCTFDYKTEGRRLLEQANPLVAAPKLPKI